jgi:phosphoglycerate kinase
MGGAKVADKIGILWRMIEVADKILVGGRMAFTFLAAQGVAVGRTNVEAEWLNRAKQMLQAAKEKVCAIPGGLKLGGSLATFCKYVLAVRRVSSTLSCDPIRASDGGTSD